MRQFAIRRPKRSARVSIRVELLEDRQLLSTVSLPVNSSFGQYAVPLSVGHPVAAPTTIGAQAGPAASGPYNPSQIRHAYGVDQLTNLDGTGQTIAIVDAYLDPTIATDLAAFDTQFGLPVANLTVATPQTSQGTMSVNSGWSLETALDVEWAHAIAPGAKILLVEAFSSNDTDLLNAVTYAVNQGATQVSMSWGGGEYSSESSLNSYFSPQNAPGVTFLASSGDTGGQLLFPAISPYVTSVGGTTLTLDSAGNRITESTWSSGGGGTSAYITEPAFQQGFQSTGFRTTPDVSYDADPSTGVYVYNNGGWVGVGGTSAGSPQWAGLIALANEGLANAGKSSVGTGQTYGTNSVLYSLAGGTSYTNPKGDFLDITTGNNTHPATIGYDQATGLGSPIANQLIPDLIGPTTPAVPTVGDSGFETIPVGSGLSAYVYAPTGSPWTFSGSPGNGSGVAGNGSGFTFGNPNAPVGTQVAFLQTQGTITQTLAGWTAGTYTIAFSAAQRGNFGNAQENFEVLIDGKVVSTFLPTGISYQTYTTASFTVTAGAHTIEFLGLDTAGGDNTVFLADVKLATA